MKSTFYTYLLSIFLLVLAFQANSATHNIYVDGAYNGDEGVMDKLIDDRLKETRDQMERIDPTSKNETVDSKDDLLEALKKIECKCGDEINLFFMGHGGKDGTLVFSQKKGKKLSVEDLREALGNAAKECCCKINVVIFACHSGSLLEPLFEEEHIRSVYTSSLKKECSYTSGYFDESGTFIDGGDWLKGFNENLKAVRKGASAGEAIATATKSAKEKMPIQFHDRQHPEGWVKDTLAIKGHVDDKIKTDRVKKKKYVEITIYEPEHLRGQKKRIYFDGDKIPESLKECMWIEGRADFSNPEDPVSFVGSITDANKPVERILAHVEARKNNGKALKIHTFRPNWLFCKTQEIKLPKGKKFDKRLKTCQWIDADVAIHDPYETDSVYDDIVPANPTFRVQFHIESINHNTGLVKGKILSPTWLKYKEIIISKEELAKMGKVSKCQNIWVDMTIPSEGTPTGQNVEEVHMDETKKYSSDVAINAIESPIYRPLSGTMIPKITSTNVGENEADYEVKILIDDIPEADLNSMDMDQIADSISNNQESQEEGCKCQDCKPLYEDVQSIKELPSSESKESSFKPFIPEKGKYYRLCATVIYPEDEVKGNNTTQTIIYVPRDERSALPTSFAISGTGTGETTGHVINLSVKNTGDEAESTTIGNLMIPSTGKYQKYIIPNSYLISLAPGQSIVIPLEGFCLNVTRPAVPFGHALPPFDEWLTPDMVGFIPSPESSMPPGSNYSPIDDVSKLPDLTLTYPGTEVPFPYQIDVDKHLEEAAPILFYGVEALEESISHIISTQIIPTPISSDLDKTIETMVQQGIWFMTGTLDSDEEDQYVYEDFKDKTISQIEQNTDTNIEKMPPETQVGIHIGIEDLFAGVVLVGEQAKVIKRKD